MKDLELVLKVHNTSEMVNLKLIEALRQATSTNTNIKSRSLLTTYFTQATAMNQKELCGVVKLLLRSKVKGNTVQCKCMLQFMKLCIKDKLNEKHPEEVDVLKDQFDEALMQPAMPLKQSATHVHTCVCYIGAYCMQTPRVSQILASRLLHPDSFIQTLASRPLHQDSCTQTRACMAPASHPPTTTGAAVELGRLEFRWPRPELLVRGLCSSDRLGGRPRVLEDPRGEASKCLLDFGED